MKTLPILCLLLASLTASAATFTVRWDANPPTDLVTNYVLSCSNPADSIVNTFSLGVETNGTFELNPGIWECVLRAHNSQGVSEPSNMVVLGSPIPPPEIIVGPVSGLTVRAVWHAGAFDISARWFAATNAASYTAHLINLNNNVDLIRVGGNLTASWARVPASKYRMTVMGVSTNSVSGPVTTIELGTLKPGKPQNLQ